MCFFLSPSCYTQLGYTDRLGPRSKAPRWTRSPESYDSTSSEHHQCKKRRLQKSSHGDRSRWEARLFLDLEAEADDDEDLLEDDGEHGKSLL